ncbi:uncharacterized protein LOC128203344 [Mya arenaria]|uniref:uncharacterized protein LOC128203344 n=1 Tax=Mya arenaria TaxID=6604 RepID=UPI0022E67E13|nr:uncharacterized protein LOC128203344 [Mya arenaria]
MAYRTSRASDLRSYQTMASRASDYITLRASRFPDISGYTHNLSLRSAPLDFIDTRPRKKQSTVVTNTFRLADIEELDAAEEKATTISTGYSGYTKIVLLIMRCAVRMMKRLLLRFIASLQMDLNRFLDKYKEELLDTDVGEKYRYILYPTDGGFSNFAKWDMSLLSCVFAEVFRRILVQHVSRVNATFDRFLMRHRISITSTPAGRAYMTVLYPKTGRYSHIRFWNLSLLATVLHKACKDPLHIPSHLFRDIGYIFKLRKELYHYTEPLLGQDDYARYLTSIKGFINRGLVYLNNKPFRKKTLHEAAEIENGLFFQEQGRPAKVPRGQHSVTERIDNIDKKIDNLYKLLLRLEDGSHSEPMLGNETMLSQDEHSTGRSEGNPLPSRLNHIRESLDDARRDLNGVADSLIESHHQRGIQRLSPVQDTMPFDGGHVVDGAAHAQFVSSTPIQNHTEDEVKDNILGQQRFKNAMNAVRKHGTGRGGKQQVKQKQSDILTKTDSQHSSGTVSEPANKKFTMPKKKK